MIVCAMQMIVAQDVIVTRQAERIDAKVLEVSETEIKYKKSSNLNGPTFVLSTEKIASILYANGEVQVFEQQQSKTAEEKPQMSVPDRKIEDGVVLFRQAGRIVVNNNGIYEPDNLMDLLGENEYNNYKDARRSYNRATVSIVSGWICSLAGGVFISEGLNRKKDYTVVIGAIIMTAGQIVLPIGYIVQGISAGRISRIAEGYNADAKRQLGMDMTVAPSLLLAGDGTVAPGVGFSLRF